MLKRGFSNALSYKIENIIDILDQKSKYSLELLQNNDTDYTLLEKSFGIKDKRNAKIYRVITNKEEKSFQTTYEIPLPLLLLLHGTDGRYVKSILKNGIKPSLDGFYGTGIYMSNSWACANIYGSCYGQERGIVRKVSYLFVNEVKLINTQEPLPFREIEWSFTNFINSFPCMKENIKIGDCPKVKEHFISLYMQSKPTIREMDTAYTRNSTPVLTADYFNNNKNHKLDSKNRYINNGRFKYCLNEKEIVCHPALVQPAYLFELKTEPQSLIDIAFDVFMHSFHENREKLLEKEIDLETTENRVRYKLLSQQRGQNNKLVLNKNITKTDVEEDLLRVINSVLKDQTEIINGRYYYKIVSKLEQLLLDTKSLFDTEHTKNFQYETKILNKKDNDYIFVLNSLKNITCKSLPEVMSVYRIKACDENKVHKTSNHLFFSGVKSTQVKHVLKSGFNANKLLGQCKMLRCNKEDYSCNASNSEECPLYTFSKLDNEINKGLSYCQIENRVTKRSYVFLASYKDKKLHFKPTKSIATDSNGKVIVNSRKNHRKTII